MAKSVLSEYWSDLRYWERASFPNHPLIDRLAPRAARFPQSIVESVGGWWHRDDFEEVEKFCLFIGHGRSGHSLIGALLDAHPKMIIAYELDSLRSVNQGISRRRLFYQLLARSQWFKRRGAESAGYTYDLPSQFQGEFTSLTVIGDKKGGGSSHHLRQDPDLLKRLYDTVDLPLHVIHVKRHPLDNISTQARRASIDVDAAIERYFRQCETVKATKERFGDADWLNWIDVLQEDFVYETKATLQTICDFLGVDTTNDYLSDCAEIVFDSPSRSRTKVTYSEDQRDRIRRKASTYPTLSQYSI